MKLRAVLPLIVGLVLAGVAIKLVQGMLQSAQGAERSDMVQVVTAKIRIPMATEIGESVLEVSQVAKALAPDQAVSDPSELVGRVAGTDIPAGLPVTELVLSPKGTKPGLSSRIPKGYRAVAVKVDEYSSVGGFLKPGCRVDVAAVMTVKRANGCRNETVSKVILQDVEVSAVGQDLGGSAESTGTNLSKSVTLLLRPEEVSRLHLAASRGDIRLALRNDLDGRPKAALTVATEAELLGEGRADKRPASGSGLGSLLGRMITAPQPTAPVPTPEVAPQAPLAPPKRHVVEVVLGDQVQQVAFATAASTSRLRADGPSARSGPPAAKALALPPQVEPAAIAELSRQAIGHGSPISTME